MSTLSQFFQSPGTLAVGSGKVRFFTSSGTVTVPSAVTYMGYGVLGGGGGSAQMAQPVSCSGLAGSGGGFSWWDGPVSSPTNLTVCATVGAAGKGACSCNGNNMCHVGGTSCVTGVPVGIYATGGGSATSYCCSSGVFVAVGCGVGGCINTCGGFGMEACAYGVAGGGGAGGLLGNGGNGSCMQYYSSTDMTAAAGGGGFGSGGGGGASSSNGSPYKFGGKGGGGAQNGQHSNSNYTNHARGGNGLMGRGAYFQYGYSIQPGGYPCYHGTGIAGESGNIIGYTDNGKLSQAKTFFGAAGGGAAGGNVFCGLFCCHMGGAAPAGEGGGGSGWGNYYGIHSFPGFGGGGGAAGNVSGLNTRNDMNGGIGGGGGTTVCGVTGCGGDGGAGIAIVEWWE